MSNVHYSIHNEPFIKKKNSQWTLLVIVLFTSQPLIQSSTGTAHQNNAIKWCFYFLLLQQTKQPFDVAHGNSLKKKKHFPV